MKTEITITIYRAAQPGVEEDAWQVSVPRGANIHTLKEQIGVLYGLPPLMQTLRRDVDSAPLADAENLGCDEADILHLTFATPGELMMGSIGAPGMGMDPLAGITEVMNDLNEAVNEVAAMSQAMQQSLEGTIYNLTFVMPAKGSAPEKRCRLEISAVSRVEDVLDMVKLELDAEHNATGLEFAGEELPQHAPIHVLGVRDGDLLMVLGRGQEMTSI